jgi:hypothetical protein
VLPELLPELTAGTASLANAQTYVRRCNSMGCQRCLAEWCARWWGVKPSDIPDDAWSELDRISDPSNRRPDRYYCAAHTVSLSAGVALWWGKAMPLGHVGCAIQIPQPYVDYYKKKNYESTRGSWMTDEYAASNTFNVAGIRPPVAPATREVDCVQNPLQFFADKEYWYWKPMLSSDGNFEAAMIGACEQGSLYSLLGNNCIDAAFRVLGDFGIDLPPPAYGLDPLLWFWELPGDNVKLKKISAKERAALDARLAEQSFGTDSPDTIAAGEDVSAVRSEVLADIGVVYCLKGGTVAHLSRDCSALVGSVGRLSRIKVGRVTDLDELEERAGIPICGVCLRSLTAGSRSRHKMMCGNGSVDIRTDVLAITTPGGFFTGERHVEIPLRDITNKIDRPIHMFSSWADLLVYYNVTLPNGRVTSSFVELKFDSEADRDEFRRQLDKATREFAGR